MVYAGGMKKLLRLSWLPVLLLSVANPVSSARTAGLDLQHVRLAPLALSNWLVGHGYPCSEVSYPEFNDRLNGLYTFRGDGLTLRKGEQAVTTVTVKAGKVTIMAVTWDAPAPAALVNALRAWLTTRLGKPQATGTTPNEPPYGACRWWRWKPAGRTLELTASVHPYLCILSLE